MKKVAKAVAKAASPVVVESRPVGQLTDRALVAPDRSLLDMTTKLGEHTQRLVSASRQVASCFVDIGRELAALRDDKGVLAACGYADIYDYSEKVLGFKRTSTKNFISVFERFGKGLSWGGKYKDYSFTQLVELLPVKDGIDGYRPDMTVQAIRDQKLLDKVKAESKSFDEYLGRAFLLCGSFLAAPALSETPKDHYGSEGSKTVSGSFSSDAGLVKVSFDVCFDKAKKEFACHGIFWVGKKSLYVYESAKTPSLLSGKLAAFLRKKLREREDGKAVSKRGSVESASAKVPAWKVWYDLSLVKKLESVSKERILDGADKGDPVFFLLNRDAEVGQDGLSLLTEETFYFGKNGFDDVPFRIYGLYVEGKIQSLMMVGIDGGGKSLFATDTPRGIVDAVMRFIEDKLIAKTGKGK
ncbi:MAG: hypothetical protein LKG11_04890 [Bacilli bacterium]|jgi:hypothetical protein|nr:hypothetical protein [Bacilli bacterium]